MPTPTQKTTAAFTEAYNHFNATLFGDQLPECLITLQRKNKAYGYFARRRFGDRSGVETIDEIAMNPSHFKNRTDIEVLSTLAHEMVHLWQEHFGEKKPKTAYHNKEWAAKMHEIGLHPSSTGAEGGKETGQKVSHYIKPHGRYSTAYAALEANGFKLPYVELWTEAKKAAAKKKAASKTKFTCPACNANAWGKPDLKIICAECDVLMLAEEADDET